MANPYQQRARQRKIVYWALIGVLLTGSLMLRKWVVEPQANNLQLRETTRGEVELTGSAVRLLLTGSKGLAVPILWSSAIEMQKKHQWNELELVVGSVTKLQPYFITPWLFQGWNMAWNVAVESDRPRDKYYYVSRGLEIYAEGERRNQGTSDDVELKPGAKPRFPGHPELRHHIGFCYQLKIGNSDEKNTMRCLLDLSTIHPRERNPDDFWTTDERSRKKIDEEKFNAFAEKYPRLVRRLRDSLRYTRPQIVTFLERNRDVPTRFKKGSGEASATTLEEPRRQFPILPPWLRETWPNLKEPDLALEKIAPDGQGESFDVFMVARTWYEYAQMPLPEPNRNPGVDEVDFDRLRHRMPKAMAVQIFRGYPARAQSFIAETMQAEGWYDSEGWVLPEWPDRVGGQAAAEVVVGAKTKNDSGRAWGRAHAAYLDYGTNSGLFIPAPEVARLDRQAELARKTFSVGKTDRIPPIRTDLKQGELGASYNAHMKLVWNDHYRSMCNYDAHLYQAEGESDRLTVQARKLFHEAEQARRINDPDVAVPLYEEAWPLWIQACLRHPRFAAVSNVMEDAYELNFYYLRMNQRMRAHLMQPVLMAMAQFTTWPHPSWEEWLDSSQKNKIHQIRAARGPLDGVQYYDGPEAAALRFFLLWWTAGAASYNGTAFVPPNLMPDQQYYLLTRWGAIDAIPPLWKPIVTPDAMLIVKSRLGLK
jgi:hypothetical protein